VPAPASAMSAHLDLTRASAKLSKATFSKMGEMLRLALGILGLKSMTDDEITTARSANEKEETDAAAQTAKDEKDAATAAKAEDAAGTGKGTPAPAAAPAPASTTAAATAELTRKLGESETKNAALEKRLLAVETRLLDPKTRINVGGPGAGDPPGGTASMTEKMDEEYRQAVLDNNVTAVISLQRRGYRPSREIEYSVVKELKRRGGVPVATSQGGN